MPWANNLKSVEYSDDEKYDRMKSMMGGPMAPEPPDYPYGFQFALTKEDLEQAGCSDGEPGDEMHFAAMGEVTSCFAGREDCRIEVQLAQFAGEDGKFFELSQPACICFTTAELEKLEMSDNAERGDMVHLIGTARVESTSSTEYGGDMVTLQITAMTCEDESSESRAG